MNICVGATVNIITHSMPACALLLVCQGNGGSAMVVIWLTSLAHLQERYGTSKRTIILGSCLWAIPQRLGHFPSALS